MAGTNLEISILPSIDPTPSQEVERISCGRAHYDGSNPSCAEVSKGWWQLARCYRDSPITWHVAAPSFRDNTWCCIFLARWNGRRIEAILSVVSLASLGQWLIQRCRFDGCLLYIYVFQYNLPCQHLEGTCSLPISAHQYKDYKDYLGDLYFFLVFTCFNWLGESSNWWYDIHQHVAHAVMESPVSPGVHYQPWHSILRNQPKISSFIHSVASHQGLQGLKLRSLN